MSTQKKKSIGLIAGYVVVAIFFITVNPQNLSLIFILVPFGLIFILLYMTLTFGLDFFFTLSKHQKRVIALVASVMPVLLLVIQSITQLTMKDVLLCIAIAVIMLWYFIKLNQKAQS